MLIIPYREIIINNKCEKILKNIKDDIDMNHMIEKNNIMVGPTMGQVQMGGEAEIQDCKAVWGHVSRI